MHLIKYGVGQPRILSVQHCTAQYYYTAQFYYLSLGRPLTLAATYRTSALPPKADIQTDPPKCLLLTQSGLYGSVDSALRGSYNLAYRRRLIL